ncbi:MAG: Rab family GTPase [Candidatus Hermodarchaeota archaeon]
MDKGLLKIQKKNYVFKILVAGDGGVGKTTLLRRFVKGIFDESTIETVGVDFFLKEIEFDEVKCSLQLWDLGGQERFRHLLENFIMGSRAALLLMDLTRLPKMQDIVNWVNMVRLHDMNLPILLIGTKYDLEDAIAIDDESALTIKNTFSMFDYVKTSSKTGYNVDEVFERITKELIKKSKY